MKLKKLLKIFKVNEFFHKKNGYTSYDNYGKKHKEKKTTRFWDAELNKCDGCREYKPNVGATGTDMALCDDCYEMYYG